MPETRARTCTSRAPSVPPTPSKRTRTLRGALSRRRTPRPGTRAKPEIASWRLRPQEAVDDAPRAAPLLFLSAVDAEEPLQPVVTHQHAEKDLGCKLRVVAAQLARRHGAGEIGGEPRDQRPGAAGVHRAGERREARHLGHHGAQRRDALRAEHPDRKSTRLNSTHRT